MRILQLTTHLDVGGISTYVATLTRSLLRRRHQVFVASSGGALESALGDGALPWTVDLRTKSEAHPKVWLAARRLRGLLRQTPADVIHAHTRVAQVAAALVSRSTRIPYVTTCHGFFRPRLGRRCFPCWGERVIAISRSVEAHLLQDFHVPEPRVRLVLTGLDAARAARVPTIEEQETWRKGVSLAPGDQMVATMTRLVPSKGVDIFLRAIADAARSAQQLRGVVIGDGEDRHRLQQLATQLGLGQRVVFAGTVADPAPLLSLCHAFLFTATGLEGLGLSVLEAMAQGLPVIASKVGGVSELVEHGYTGFLVPPGDARAVAERIGQFLEDPSLARRMGAAARATVADRFSAERMAEQVEAVYHEVTGSRR